jgi:hypothetical protein
MVPETIRAWPWLHLVGLLRPVNTSAFIAELIARLGETDRQRAERFAVRNGMRREYLRYQELSFGIAEAETIRLAEPEATESSRARISSASSLPRGSTFRT